MGPFPRRQPLDVRTLGSSRQSDHVRTLVEYTIDGQTRAQAYLLTPPGPPRPAPGVVVLHQTTARNADEAVGMAGRESIHFGRHLVARGFPVIAPRNYLWSRPGESYQQAAERLIRPPGRWKTGMARMAWDAIRATDVLLAQTAADPRRIGTIGHSLGGKQALYHAAFDERIRATVSCEGGIGLRFSNWDADWYLGRQIREPQFTADHHELLALVAPRAFMLIGGESADGARSQPYVDAARPAWEILGAPSRLVLLRHRYGHDFPPPGKERDQVYSWLEEQLAG